MKRVPIALCVLAVACQLGCHHEAHPTAPARAVPTPAAPAPPPATASAAAAPVDEYARLRAMDLPELNRLGILADVHFDFDRAELLESERAVLRKDADALKRFDFLLITIEGHADERGTVEYNLALGDRRSKAAFDYLVSLGVPAARMKLISYGKESPVCTEHAEECWAKNRRAHVVVTGKLPLV